MADLKRLKTYHALTTYLQQLGHYPTKSNSKRDVYSCPLPGHVHGKGTPSFTISKGKGWYTCFGSCGSGTAIDLWLAHGGDLQDQVRLQAWSDSLGVSLEADCYRRTPKRAKYSILEQPNDSKWVEQQRALNFDKRIIDSLARPNFQTTLKIHEQKCDIGTRFNERVTRYVHERGITIDTLRRHGAGAAHFVKRGHDFLMFPFGEITAKWHDDNFKQVMLSCELKSIEGKGKNLCIAGSQKVGCYFTDIDLFRQFAVTDSDKYLFIVESPICAMSINQSLLNRGYHHLVAIATGGLGLFKVNSKLIYMLNMLYGCGKLKTIIATDFIRDGMPFLGSPEFETGRDMAFVLYDKGFDAVVIHTALLTKTQRQAITIDGELVKDFNDFFTVGLAGDFTALAHERENRMVNFLDFVVSNVW